MHGIYQIRNKETGDCYIGSAVNLKKRTTQHISLLRNKKSKHIHLQRAWDKFGESTFEIHFLEIIENREKLIEREQYYIDLLIPTYNVRIIAQSNLGLKDPREIRIKKSEVAKARGQSEKQIQGLIKAQNNRKGIPVIGKVKESLRLGPISMIGIPKSDLTKDRIRQTKLGAKNYMFGISQEQHPSSKKVINLTTNEIYPSAKQCATELNKSYVHVNMILRGLRKNTLKIEYID